MNVMALKQNKKLTWMDWSFFFLVVLTSHKIDVAVQMSVVIWCVSGL